MSLKRRTLICVLWLPYVLALCTIWGFIFDYTTLKWPDSHAHRTPTSWFPANRHIFILAGFTIVVPLFASWLTRYLFIAFTTGRNMRRRADHCPRCDYALPPEGEHTCPECGLRSTHADRTALTPAAHALRDLPWLRRFTLSVIIGFVGGPTLALLENAIIHRNARLAFATPAPTSPLPTAAPADYNPQWTYAEYLYSDHPGGRLFWSPGSWRKVAINATPTPEIFRHDVRITPWSFVCDKFVQSDGRIFLDFD